MAKEITAEFKTLLTKEEYDRIYEKVKEHSGNLQTNYYFDTKRFTLKATDAVLRVKHREVYTLTLERKKGFIKTSLLIQNKGVKIFGKLFPTEKYKLHKKFCICFSFIFKMIYSLQFLPKVITFINTSHIQ